METLTDAAYHQRRQENLTLLEKAHHTNGFDLLAKCQTDWSDDEYLQVELRPGLYLEISDETFHHDLGIECEHDAFQAIVSKFYLSGHHSVISPAGIDGVPAHYAETGGQHYLFYLPQIEEIEQFHGGDRVFKLAIEMDLEYLRTLSLDLDTVPQLLRPVLESNAAPQFHRPVGQLTPTMKTIVQQIWQMPYQGMIGRIYLESKALELVALQLAQLQAIEQGRYPSLKLKPMDRERIHQAQEILTRHYANPPSLMELAQQVGLSDYKLKRGFLQMFGMTAFGYLHHRVQAQVWRYA
jgi:AraC family transcriptional regulator, transcriptional activator of the genes for pyochelin and ferripyochelin receptors